MLSVCVEEGGKRDAVERPGPRRRRQPMTELVAAERLKVAVAHRDAVPQADGEAHECSPLGLNQRDRGFDVGSPPWATVRSASRNGPPAKADPNARSARKGA